MQAPRIVVVGSVNLDLVARCPTLPRPGETVTGAVFDRVPGGKGANQAVACARLGADVTMIAAVGRDSFAAEALAGLREAGVELRLEESEQATGVALITVDAAGETTITVAPGANDTLAAVDVPEADAVLCQLEIPDAAVVSAWEQASGTFCLNAAPARPIAVDADLTVVNRYELDVLARRDGLVALTLGAEGAVLLEDGAEVARATPPDVDACRRHRGRRRLHRLPARLSARGTHAGRGAPPRLRGRGDRRLAAGRPALTAHHRRGRRHPDAVTRCHGVGAAGILGDMDQRTPVILDCDPGHDDAIALLFALASPELEVLGVTTVHGNQTLEKTTANALRVLDLADRRDIPVAAGADRPLERELTVAAHVHGESGLDGPALPPPGRAPMAQHAVDFMIEQIVSSPRPVTLVPTGPLTNIALLLDRIGDVNVERIVLMGGAIAEGNMTPAAEFNIWADPEAAARVFAVGPRCDDDRPRRDAPGGDDARDPGAARARRAPWAPSSPTWSTSSPSTTATRTAGTEPRSTTPWQSPTSSGPGSSRPWSATSRSSSSPTCAAAAPSSTSGTGPAGRGTRTWASTWTPSASSSCSSIASAGWGRFGS